MIELGTLKVITPNSIIEVRKKSEDLLKYLDFLKLSL